MWPFKPKPPTPKAEPQEIVVVFHANDDMHKRAENIWRGLGFANDRFNAIPQIAGWLSMYREWDRKIAALGESKDG